MSSHAHYDDLSLSFLKKDLLRYSWTKFASDLSAAFSVALLALPQAMAYSLLAGLPLFCGLFAVIYPAAIAALLGSSRHLVAGPSNATAILVQAGTATILYNHFREVAGEERSLIAVQILTLILFLSGLIQILAAVCRLGRLTQFISHSVVVGYLAGTVIAVIVNQLFVFLGVPRQGGVHSFYERGVYLLSNLSEINWPTTLVGIVSLCLLILLPKISRRIPTAVAMLIITSILVLAFKTLAAAGSSYVGLPLHEVFVLGEVTTISSIFPSFDLPYFNMSLLSSILPISFAIALLSTMETTSVAKNMAAYSGQRLSINQEIFSLGIANFFSCFISAMPISGSPSRSNLNYRAGGQTRFAAFFAAIFVFLILWILDRWIALIPLPSLAAMLVLSSLAIVDKNQFLLCLRSTNSDAFVLIITFLSCLFFSLDLAFYAGISLSIILYLKKAAVPHIVECSIEESGKLKNLDMHQLRQHRPIRVIKVEGELFFGAADLFQTALKTIAKDDKSTKVLVLQLKDARDIDATVCLTMGQLNDYLKSTGRHLIACGITFATWDILSSSGVAQRIGKENLFLFEEEVPHRHMQKAIARAKNLLDTPVLGDMREQVADFV
jgi:SulP family sulfate permease